MTHQAPIIRWAGSKRKLISTLQPLATAGARYLEPFAGSAALFFALAPEKSVLSDVNSELIDTYSAIVSDPRKVYEAACALEPTKEMFLALRRLDVGLLEPVERAARFLYLNRYCFNGLYRTNRAGLFNVPYAPARSGGFPSWRSFDTAASQLRRARLVCSDFETVLRRYAAPGDFVYLDPPYAVENRRVFKQYTAQTFGLEDLERLASSLHALDALGARFLVSYAYCAEALYLLRGWNTRKVFTQRNISGFAEHRRTAAEVLVFNFAA